MTSKRATRRTRQVREWAFERGLLDRPDGTGRLPASVIDAYNKAHRVNKYVPGDLR